MRKSRAGKACLERPDVPLRLPMQVLLLHVDPSAETRWGLIQNGICARLCAVAHAAWYASGLQPKRRA